MLLVTYWLIHMTVFLFFQMEASFYHKSVLHVDIYNFLCRNNTSDFPASFHKFYFTIKWYTTVMYTLLSLKWHISCYFLITKNALILFQRALTTILRHFRFDTRSLLYERFWGHWHFFLFFYEKCPHVLAKTKGSNYKG